MKNSVIFAMVLFFAVSAFAWETNYVAPGSSQVGLAQNNVFFKRFVSTSTGTIAVDVLATYHANDWHEQAVEGAFPEYPCSYGSDVKSTSEHSLIETPSGLYGAVVGKYSTSRLTSEGILAAVFLKPMDGTDSDWIRVSPVGVVSCVDFAVDKNGIIWFVWGAATNLQPGNVFVSSYNPVTGEIGAAETVGAASMRLSFKSNRIVIKNNQFWVVWRSDTGITARKRTPSGNWQAPVQVLTASYPPFMDAVIYDCNLYVIADRNNGELYRSDDGFTLIQSGLFPGYDIETDTYMESVRFSEPAFETGGNSLRIAAARSYYFEDSETGEDANEYSTVVWTDGTIETVSDKTWNNVGGEFVPGFVAGGGNQVFVVQE